MKKMSDKDKKLLYIFGAIIIVAASYFLVFQNFSARTTELRSENSSLRQEVSDLESKVSQKATILEETRKCQENIAATLAKFPSQVKTEDAIYNLNQMYKQIQGVNIQSEGYTMNQVFYQPSSAATSADGTTASATPAAPAASETPDPAASSDVAQITEDTPVQEIVSAAADYTGFRSDIAVAFTAPYEALKEVIDYINNSSDRMTISTISATKSEDSSDLTCAMTVSMYAITGTGEIYEEPNITGVEEGVNNLFRGK